MTKNSIRGWGLINPRHWGYHPSAFGWGFVDPKNWGREAEFRGTGPLSATEKRSQKNQIRKQTPVKD